MSQRFELEQQYFLAKEAYYSGEPIMSDDEFDRLESELKTLGSEAPYIVGAEDRKAKYSHPSPMLSLSKLQASLAGDPPTAGATAWMTNIGNHSYEISPKYDGNAANVIYKNGKLLQVLSRGAGNKGRDITDKVRHNVPDTLDIKETVEIRGEVVIKTSTFNQKYSEYKNPRNYVAGVLNRDENPSDVIADLDFIPVEVRIHKEDGLHFIPPMVHGFKHRAHVFYISQDNFEVAYHDMTKYRKTSDYQLDGFVIKAPETFRPKLGENSHDPNWAIAIKFPPKEAITKIVSISWQYGKTGELCPVAIMEPIDLDGSTVSRASLFNYGYIKAIGAYPGAIVAIAKSGDIIPQITRVITPGTGELEHPTTCQCGSLLKINGIHLHCSSDSCTVKDWYKFYLGVRSLDLDGVGAALIKQFWDAGFKNALELLDPVKMNRATLVSKGIKDGKILDNMLKEITKVKQLRPRDIIITMGILGMGNTIATQVGNYLTGIPHDFKGLEKSVIAGFEPGGHKRSAYEKLIEQINPYIKIVLPEQISSDSIGIEFTGSPKSFGYKTKEEFLSYAKSKGYHHAGLKEAKVLFTDDLNSTSSKMATARATGIEIMLYSEI
jgi:DNA ligase (NAD+)